jgi:acetyl-CoA carboxylase biotin carboxyl carrier protein
VALSEKDLLEILKLLEQSAWEDLELETPTFKLAVSKKGPLRGAAPSAGVGSGPTAAPRSTVAIAPPRTRAAEDPPPGALVIASPTLGNFYAAPQPGAPPFVSVGDRVGPEDTVAIVEVMKLMNHVPAGARGTILKVCARNGELVEYGEALFWLAPTPDGEA